MTNVEFIRSPQSPPLAQYLVSSDWFHTSHIFPSTTVTLFFSPPRPPPPSHPPTHTSRPVRIDNGGLQHRIRVLGRAMPTSPLPPRGSQRQRGTTMHASALLPPPRQQGGGVVCRHEEEGGGAGVVVSGPRVLAPGAPQRGGPRALPHPWRTCGGEQCGSRRCYGCRGRSAIACNTTK